MKKVVAIIVFAVLLGADLSAQSTKRATKLRVSPCGVPIPTFAQFQEEQKIEWRKIGETSNSIVYYNTRKNVCDQGILKGWTKSYDKPAVSGELSEAAENMLPLEDRNNNKSYSLIRYELNCRSNQVRTTSKVRYTKEGVRLESFTVTKPEWMDMVPESMGEHIWETLCRKTP